MNQYYRSTFVFALIFSQLRIVRFKSRTSKQNWIPRVLRSRTDLNREAPSHSSHIYENQRQTCLFETNNLRFRSLLGKSFRIQLKFSDLLGYLSDSCPLAVQIRAEKRKVFLVFFASLFFFSFFLIFFFSCSCWTLAVMRPSQPARCVSPLLR